MLNGDFRVIDNHAHIHIDTYFPDRQGYFAEDLIRQMDKDGVDISLVSDACFSFANTGSDYVLGNDHCLDAMQKYPRRIKGIAILNPYAQGIEVMRAEADRVIEKGFVGYKMHPTCHHHPANELWGVDPAAEKAIEHDVPLWIHTGEAPFSTPIQIIELAERHPEAKIVLGHRGHTMFPDLRYFSKRVSNLWVDISFLTNWELPFIELREIGIDRILFGSDYPTILPKIMMDVVMDSDLTRKEKAKILGENTRELYKID